MDITNPSEDQLRIVEALIREHPGYTRMELWNLLPYPQEMSYSTFGNLICALVRIKKVAVDSEDRYCWIYNVDLTEKYLSQPALLIK